MLSTYLLLQSWFAKRIEDRDRGATAVEYGLLVGMIAVAIIGVIALLGPQLAALFQSVVDGLTPAP